VEARWLSNQAKRELFVGNRGASNMLSCLMDGERVVESVVFQFWEEGEECSRATDKTIIM